jgi:uncharacterized Zn finger protein (UPF0148 family)
MSQVHGDNGKLISLECDRCGHVTNQDTGSCPMCGSEDRFEVAYRETPAEEEARMIRERGREDYEEMRPGLQSELSIMMNRLRYCRFLAPTYPEASAWARAEREEIKYFLNDVRIWKRDRGLYRGGR